MPDTKTSRSDVGIRQEDIEESAARLGIVIDGGEAAHLPQWVERTLRFVNSLESVPTGDAGRTPPREFRWATREEDPLNAFITFCRISGRAEGPLRGLRVAVKDCIAVAGVPLTDGGGREPYPVPERDAIVVERLLGAGADIVGKTNMEDMAVGTGIGSHFGATSNPLNPAYQTGGSSSGSAAAVGAGLADVGLGTDQAGSVRIPAAWCGLVGMKPTHGLVPSRGISRMDPTLDHVGPITRDVATNARVLACLAGRPGQFGGSEGRSAVQGVRIGLVSQSVQSAPLADDLRRAFDEGVGTLQRLGTTVEDVEVPLWTSALPVFQGAVAHGVFGIWMSGGCGFGMAEVLDDRVVEKAPIRSNLRSGAVPPRVLTRLLLATYVHRHMGGLPIERALNLRMMLTEQIETCFERFDLLVTPTVCKVADPLPEERPSRESLVLGDGRELLNTVPLDLSGHPALTVPCGEAENGLPVGLQLIGRRHDEETLYAVASLFEAERA